MYGELHSEGGQKPWQGGGLARLQQELKLDRNLEAGADTEAMEECCLLACSPWLAQPVFFIAPRTTSTEVTSSTMGWALPHC